MRGLLVAALMLVCLQLPASAQEAVAPADRSAIQSVISGQIDAFRHDDGVAAFGLAAPNIHARFGNDERFLSMVRQAYRPVYRPRSFAFGALTPEDGRLVQQVQLIGPDGQAVLALYDMEREPDGTWRIAGCTLIEGERLES